MGVSLDSALTYQDEVKRILRKMACDMKTLYSLRELISDNYKALTLNALVNSHIHYSAVFLNGINNNLIKSLEKQLSWGVKACFHRKKYDISLDLKIKNKILPISHFLDQNLLFYSFEDERSNKTRLQYQNSIQLFRKLRIQVKYNNL